MVNAKFNLEEYCNSYKYFSIYLDLRFKLDGIKRSEILKGADVYQSAFSIAKRHNFIGHDDMIRKFEKYYNLQSLSSKELKHLNENLTNLFLGIYYMNSELREKSYQLIQIQKDKIEYTYISIILYLADLLYEISKEEYNPNAENVEVKLMLENVGKYYDLLLPEFKIMFWLISFSIRDYTIKELTRVIVEISELSFSFSYLKGYISYRIAYVYHRIGYYEASIQYYKESMGYMIEDVNMKRIKYVQTNLFVSYGNIGMTMRAYNQGVNLLHYLNSINDYGIVSYSVYYNMALICVELEKNEEALQYMQRAYEHDCYKIGQVALYMFICYSLKDYETVKKLYSENLELIETTNLGVYQKTIELIYHKVEGDVSKKQLRKDWKEINDFLIGTSNYNVARYIDKLK